MAAINNTTIYSINQVLSLIGSPTSLDTALEILTAPQVKFTLFTLTNLKKIANSFSNYKQKEAFICAFLEKAGANFLNTENKKKDLKEWLQESFINRPTEKQNVLDYLARLNGNPTTNQNQQKTNKIFPMTINKNYIDDSANKENDEILKSFASYNGLLISFQKQMTPDWILQTGKNYQVNKNNLFRKKPNASIHDIESNILNVKTAPNKPTENKSVIHASLVKEGLKIQVFLRAWKGMILNDTLLPRVYHTYKDECTNKKGVLDPMSHDDKIMLLDNEAYFKKAENRNYKFKDAHGVIRYNEVMVIPNYQNSYTPEFNAVLNIKAYFLGLPVGEYHADLKKIFLQDLYNQPDDFDTRKIASEVLMKEIAQSIFPLYVFDPTNGTLNKLNKDAVIHAIYQARKELLQRAGHNTSNLDALYQTCMGQLYQFKPIIRNELPVKILEIPLEPNPNKEKDGKPFIRRKDTKSTGSFLERIKEFFKKPTQVSPAIDTAMVNVDFGIQAQSVLLNLGLPSTESSVLVDLMAKKVNSAIIYEQFKMNPLIQDFFKQKTNDFFSDQINNTPNTLNNEVKNQLIVELQNIKRYFDAQDQNINNKRKL